MSTPCYIGIDLGTSGCRAAAIDAQGRPLTSVAVPLPAGRKGPRGESEQSPDAWWQATVTSLRRLTQALPHHTPAAVAVDGTSASLLLVTKEGRPVTPGLMYDDRRARQQARYLARLAPHQAAVQGPGASLAKLLWLKEQGLLRPGLRALHQAEWITGRLAGRFDLGDENNALKLGYDPVAAAWPQWMARLDLPADLLPRVVAAGTPIGPCRAHQTGLPSQCQVVAGTTDSTAAALAAGLARAGDALTSLGSTLVFKILLDEPLFSAPLGIYSHRILGRWLAGGASNSGGRVLAQHFTAEELDLLSRRIDPSRGLCLDYYPLPGPGERFPIADPDLAPRMTPVPRDRARFLQGLLEGMARIEKLAYRRLVELGAPKPRRVASSGGGAANSTWRAIRQRILGLPVFQAQADTAVGSARLARAGMLQGNL